MSHGFLIMGYLELKITDQLVNPMNMKETQQTLEKDESLLLMIYTFFPMKFLANLLINQSILIRQKLYA